MIQKVEVVSGCIACRNCENICPSVFRVAPTSQVISQNYEGKESEILQAEALCPVNVIKVTQDSSLTLKFKSAQLQEKKWLTSDILELRFSTENFSAKPGQYISLRLSDAYGKFSRSYSLAEFGKDFFVLTVKILPKGRGGNALKKLKAGKKISFLGALGSFTLQNTLKPKVCIATGTGLAPMLEILRKADSSTKKILLLGARNESDLYHLEKLQDIPNLQIIIKISQENTQKYSQGRVTDELQNIPEHAEVYICGNPDMITSVCSALEPMKAEKNLEIFKEGFTFSSHYTGKWNHHVMQGNLPYVQSLSWGIILFSLFAVIPAWIYMQSSGNLYGNFGIIPNFMSFLFDLSWWSVVFVMLIRPLSDVFPKIGLFRTLKTFRKPLGILSATIIVVNWLGGWYFSPDKIVQYFTLAKWEMWTPILSRVSEISALILLLTSNTFSQKKLGIWWKRIQRLSYVYFITGGMIAALTNPLKIYPVMILVGIVYFVAYMKNKKRES